MAPHFLLVPLPEHGHATPMLSLASRLALLGCPVTFLTAEKAPLIINNAAPQGVITANNGAHAENPLPQIAADLIVGNDATHAHVSHSDGHGAASMLPLSTNLHFRILPYTGPPSPLTVGSPRYDILEQTLAGLEQRQEMVEMIVQDSKFSQAPIACIICDVLLCSWVIPLAKRQSIIASVLVPCSFTNFYLFQLMITKGKSEEVQRVRRSIGMPTGENAPPMTEEQKKKFEEVIGVFEGAQKHFEQSSFVLLNSCKVLETEILDVIDTPELNLRFIGPCFPASEETGDVGGKSTTKKAGCPFTEDTSCLPWLDRQEKNSVLLVSFGSEVTPDEEQVLELAMGIEASGCKFLWVVRPDAHMPPKDFLERTCNVGMCVSWSPQRRVLQHIAVGGFLTHCGWNSTLESIVFGVPMLCLPLNGDQFLNAHIIHTRWKVGLRLGPPNKLVARAEVEKCVRELMSNEEIRERIGPLQKDVHNAWLDSQNIIDSFVQEIGSCCSLA